MLITKLDNSFAVLPFYFLGIKAQLAREEMLKSNLLFVFKSKKTSTVSFLFFKT